MKTIFKVGDRVFDIRFGWGDVFEVNELQEEGVWVQFGYNDCREYNHLGMYTEFDVVPMLSFTEYTLQGFSQERPKKEPEIGSLCLFSDNEEEFNNNIGSVNKLKYIKVSLDYPYCDEEGSWWKYCKQIKIEEI